MTERRILLLRRKLQESRYRLLQENEDFALPLREMRFVAVQDLWHMSTNGKCIYFAPDWLGSLGPASLDFILCHQLMHIALGHIERGAYFKGDRFHLACDIVANAKLRDMGWEYEKLPRVGRIYHKTFFPETDGALLTAEEAFSRVPFDPAALPGGQRQNMMIDSEKWWDRPDDRGEGGIVVLRPEDEDPPDLSEERDAPDGQTKKKKIFQQGPQLPLPLETEDAAEIRETLAALRDIKERSGGMGDGDDFSERIWQRPGGAFLNWRRLLVTFLQETVCDYSFTPPDRRFYESGFFLPDYHTEPDHPKEILFFVDTSGSVDDEKLAAVYRELCGAVEQYGGSLRSRVAFFDTRVYPPAAFETTEDLAGIRPRGGGGTDLSAPFDYVRSRMGQAAPASIVIITDGKGDYPAETAAMNIPVLWILTEDGTHPPWGQTAYLTSLG